MTIRQVLEVSTIHVPVDYDLESLEFVVASGMGCVYIYVPEPQGIGEIPDWLAEVFKLANDWEVGYVCFDADGTQYEELRKYDWE